MTSLDVRLNNIETQVELLEYKLESIPEETFTKKPVIKKEKPVEQPLSKVNEEVQEEVTEKTLEEQPDPKTKLMTYIERNEDMEVYYKKLKFGQPEAVLFHKCKLDGGNEPKLNEFLKIYYEAFPKMDIE